MTQLADPQARERERRQRRAPRESSPVYPRLLVELAGGVQEGGDVRGAVEPRTIRGRRLQPTSPPLRRITRDEPVLDGVLQDLRKARDRLVDRARPAAAGAVGYLGNLGAAWVRTRADAYVSLGVVASAACVALGLDIADPLIGLAITLVILRITWESWRTVRSAHAHRHHDH